MDRIVKKYAAIYRAAIRQSNLPDVGTKAQAYAEKLTQMYASPAYREHSVYPTMNTERVYAVIAMCLMLKSYGFDSKQIVDMVCVREKYQGQGYMRRLMEMVYAEGNRLGVPVVLDTDARSKCDKYEHLCMQLAGTRDFGQYGTLYDLIKYPDAK